MNIGIIFLAGLLGLFVGVYVLLPTCVLFGAFIEAIIQYMFGSEE